MTLCGVFVQKEHIPNEIVPPRNTCKFVQATRKIAFSTVLPKEWQIELSQKVPKIQAA